MGDLLFMWSMVISGGVLGGWGIYLLAITFPVADGGE